MLNQNKAENREEKETMRKGERKGRFMVRQH